jgi:hypothetical protein
LEKYAAAREHVLGRQRGEDNGVEVGRPHVGPVECHLGRLEGEVAGQLPLANPPPLFDPGASANPLVGGIHHLGQVVIGDDTVRQIDARGDELGAHDEDRQGWFRCIQASSWQSLAFTRHGK